MADNVEGLVIEIESQAQGAVSQLDMLNERLEGLKKLVSSSASLATFSKNFQAFTNSFNVGGATSNLTQYAQAIEKISAMSNFKLNKSGINNLEYMAQAASMLGGEPLSNLERYAYAMERLSSISGFKLNKSVADNLGRIAEVAKQLDASSVQNLDAFTSALSRLQVLAEVDSKSVKELASSMKTFSSATRGATTRGRTFNTVLANIRTKTLAMYAGLTRIARGMTKSLSIYGDYVEALNLYKMAMGEAAEEGYAFAETAQKLLGIDLTQWMQAQGVFMALAKGFGVANDKAALMSQNLTQLAYDISSFYNISVEDAIQKVQSGFAGQIRPVRNLGYDLSQARLEAIALANGIDEEVKSMTQAEKSQLRYIALMTQLTEVQGDLARTLDSPTNQLRLLNAQLDQMMRSVGMVLLPMLNKIIPYLNAILRVIKMIAEEIAAMFGYTLPKISGEWSSNVSLGADELEEDLEDANGAAEKLKNTLASFDQINLITSKSGGSGSGSSSVGGSDLGLDLPSYDFLGDVNENKAQEIAESMRRKLDPFVKFIKETIQFVIDHIDEIKTLLEALAIITIGKTLINNIKEAWKWFTDLKGVVAGLGLITIGLTIAYLGGENLAQGDIVEGIIESTIGTGLAAYGGYLLAGPAGLVAGLVLGVAITYEGYKAEKFEEMKQRITDDFMKLYPDQTTITQISDSWNNFLGTFYTPEVDEKNSTAAKLKTNVDEIGTAIFQLQANYNAGTVTGVAYATNLELMYADMEKSVKDHLEAVGQAIDEYLDGPYGRWLQRNGTVVEDVKTNVHEALEEIATDFEQNGIKLAELNRQYEIGDITEEEYVKQSNEVLEALSGQYKLLGMNTEATDSFFGSLDSLKHFDVNFEKWDTLSAKLKEIKDGYEAANQSIDDNVASLQADYEILRDNAKTDAMREYWQSLIDGAEEFGREQKMVLDYNYQNMLESIENSAAIAWDRQLDQEGLKNAASAVGKEMFQLESQLAEMHGQTSLTRNKSYWTELMGSVGEYLALMGSTSEDSMFRMESFDEKAEEIIRGLREAVDENGNIIADRLPMYVKDAYTEANKNSEEGAKKFAGAIGSMGGNIDFQMKKISPELSRQLLLSVDTVRSKGEMMVSNTRTTINNMVDAFKRNGQQMPDEMNRILARTQDMIKPADFGLKGASVTKNFMDNFKKDFTPIKTVEDFKTKFSNMFQGDDAKKWGVKFGQSVKEGMDTGLSGAETGVENALKGAKTVLDQFGSASASYWSQMSKNIATVMSAIVANPTNPALKSTLSLILSGMKWTMKGFAKGGFPDSADFFYANENGVPEYIGTMGGRTAVANNAEITKGVADAVYKAIKDTGIANDIKKIASKDGKVVFAPSEEAGRVMTQSVNMYNATGGRY